MRRFPAPRSTPMPIDLPDQTAAPRTPETDAIEADDTGSKLPPKPLAEVKPAVVGYGLGAQVVALARYMARTEVHTYAFSVAANVILSLFPFIVLMLTLATQVFHSPAMKQVVGEMVSSFLPSNQDFVMRNMLLLLHPHKGAQIYSVIMLL